jgi:hypothetical protein
MAKVNQIYVGRTLARALARQQEYELIDDQDSFVVRRELTAEANLLVSVWPYSNIVEDKIRVDVTLGLQYPELQRLWNRLIEHEPEEPTASWSVLTAQSSKWAPESTRERWCWSAQKVKLTCNTEVVASALRDYGLPFCAGLEGVAPMAAALKDDPGLSWSCDRSFLLPVALFMTGKADEARELAETAVALLEAARPSVNRLYLDSYRRFAKNIGLLSAAN